MHDIKVNNCPSCGAGLPVVTNLNAVTCQYCGATLTIKGNVMPQPKVTTPKPQYKQRTQVIVARNTTAEHYTESEPEPYSFANDPVKTNVFYYLGICGVSLVFMTMAYEKKWNQTLTTCLSMLAVFSFLAIFISIIWYAVRKVYYKATGKD